MTTPTLSADAPLLYRPADAARVLNLSRSTIFDLMRVGRLRSVKEGRVRLIPASAMREYVSLLESETAR
jgi:excisionase family DNA binding protein